MGGQRDQSPEDSSEEYRGKQRGIDREAQGIAGEPAGGAVQKITEAGGEKFRGPGELTSYGVEPGGNGSQGDRRRAEMARQPVGGDVPARAVFRRMLPGLNGNTVPPAKSRKDDSQGEESGPMDQSRKPDAGGEDAAGPEFLGPGRGSAVGKKEMGGDQEKKQSAAFEANRLQIAKGEDEIGGEAEGGGEQQRQTMAAGETVARSVAGLGLP